MMKFIIEPHDGIWVAVQPRHTADALQQKILQADVCLSDLDDTDAESPAKEIALADWKRRVWEDWGYFQWFMQAGIRHVFQGKAAESASWNDYKRRFLSNPSLRQAAAELYTEEKVRSSLFPGVPELYALLPAEKYYLTRNIREITVSYAQALNFRGFFAEVENKEAFVERFVAGNRYKRYLLREDNYVSGTVLEVLHSCERRQVIDYAIGIYRADTPGKNRHGFDVEVGKDHTGLVELLKSDQST